MVEFYLCELYLNDEIKKNQEPLVSSLEESDSV